MANRMIWPPEKTCEYLFRDDQELDLVIPLEEKGKATNKSEVKGR